MSYIKPPGPPDDQVIYTTEDGKQWTWGDHHAMERSLAQLEQSDPTVQAARARLEDYFDRSGFKPDPAAVIIWQCEHCAKPEFVVHDESCPDYDPADRMVREAGGYQYYDEFAVPVFTTSAPVNDEEAFDYFRIVQLMFPGSPDFKVKFVARREMHASEYKMMPVYYDTETKKVERINR